MLLGISRLGKKSFNKDMKRGQSSSMNLVMFDSYIDYKISLSSGSFGLALLKSSIFN